MTTMPDTDPAPAPDALSVVQYDVVPQTEFPRRVILKVQCSDGSAVEVELQPHEADGLSDDLACGRVSSLALAGSGGTRIDVAIDEGTRGRMSEDLKVALVRALPRRTAFEAVG
jgi:hypothetical protein